jgi:3'(2'), 5'-bisphosphate nucleotidase
LSRALFEKLLPIARLAGEAIMAIYQSGAAQVRLKAGASPVTEADLAAQRVLAQHLPPLLDNCALVSEEDESSWRLLRDTARFWLIDPLDGTKEFIAGSGEFTVNIALIEAGRSVLGVVYAPALDALYWGGPGLGAFRGQLTQPAPIQVSPAAGGVRRVLASKNHMNAQTRAFIERLGQVQLVQAGSSLKFCRLAEGQADLYPRLAPTSEWDTAAGQAILEGAGGALLDLQGRPLTYGKPDWLNPSFIAAADAALISAY